MLSINIQDELINIKNIDQQQLYEVLEWYNMYDDFKFATGIDSPVSYDTLLSKYQSINVRKKDFYLGIFKKEANNENKFIGILYGRIYDKIIWITMIAIACEYRCLGYGNIAINLLLQYVKKEENINQAYLAVVKDNFKGINFWIKNGFNSYMHTNNSIQFDGIKHSIIIMQKRL